MKKSYPLDEESISTLARKVDVKAQDNANPVLAFVKRKEERQQRKQRVNK